MLSSSGWATEDHQFKRDLANNKGFFERLKHFAEVKDNKTVLKYNSRGGTLWGKLGVDLDSNLINGLGVILEYTLADSNFFLMGQKKDGRKLDKKFDICIDKFTVHACSHDLATPVYETIERRLKTENINIPFKRYHVTAFSISTGLLEWISDSLLISPVLVPNRLFFALLPSKLYDCDQSQNPYVFGFPRQTSATSSTTSVRPIQSDDPTTAQASGTSSNPSQLEAAEAIQTEAKKKKKQQAARTALDSEVSGKTSKIVDENTENKVTKFSVTLNGVDIDGFSSSALDQLSFFRLNKFLGYRDTNTSSSITLEEFCNGSTIYSFDFSTSLNSGQDFLIPSLKTGHLRAAIQFQKTTSEAYHLLVLSEYASNIAIGSTSHGGRTVSSNYFV